ncbi:MAG: hypothetical protein EPN97_13375 [Alphaproteobacteria bacterium]|nr:MAG: hypothetical protein EPN97_13375 [Alphaproteobacteria bacterium]
MTIFVLQKNGDIGVYQSPEEAGGDLESPDILDGEYIRAFDEEGNVYSIEVPPGTRREDERGGIEVKPGILRPTGEMARSDFFAALKRRFDIEPGGNPSLETLISRAIEAARMEREANERRVRKYGYILVGLIFIVGIVYVLLRK